MYTHTQTETHYVICRTIWLNVSADERALRSKAKVLSIKNLEMSTGFFVSLHFIHTSHRADGNGIKTRKRSDKESEASLCIFKYVYAYVCVCI